MLGTEAEPLDGDEDVVNRLTDQLTDTCKDEIGEVWP